MKRPRIKDIAKLAGVSDATVTRVLNRSGYASEEKKERVIRALEELGYEFHKGESDNSVPRVLIVSKLSSLSQNRLFSDILETISVNLQKKGWQCTVFYSSEDNFRQLAELLENSASAGFVGVIFNCVNFSADMKEMRRLLLSLPIPAVMIERFPDIFGLNKIMINAKEAVFLALKHLYKSGHRRIAFFSPQRDGEVERSRIEGFGMAISVMNLENEAHFIPIDEYSSEQGYEALSNYVKKFGLPTAIVCADPVMVGVCKYLYEKGIRIPDDISLIGLDDTNASIMTPPLTSVAFPVAEIAHTAIQLLEEGKAKNKLAKTISLSTYLIDRESVANPRK